MVPKFRWPNRSFSRFLPPEEKIWTFLHSKGAADASDCSLLVKVPMAIQFDGARFVEKKKYRIPKSLGKRWNSMIYLFHWPWKRWGEGFEYQPPINKNHGELTELIQLAFGNCQRITGDEVLTRPWAYRQTDVRRPEDLTPVRFCDNVNDLSHKIEAFLEVLSRNTFCVSKVFRLFYELNNDRLC